MTAKLRAIRLRDLAVFGSGVLLAAVIFSSITASPRQRLQASPLSDSDVMVLATANDVSRLPPELLRKGRFDEIFTLDLPTQQERAEILKIHIAKRGREPEAYPLEVLAGFTGGFNGAELEECIISGLYEAFHAGRELSTADLELAIRDTVPLSVTMREKVKAIREWGRSRARPAAEPEKEERTARLN